MNWRTWDVGYRTIKVPGPTMLAGDLSVQGSKNCAQKLVPACAAKPGEYTLRNLPLLSDTIAVLEIFEHLGGTVQMQGNVTQLDSRPLENRPIPRWMTAKSTGTFQFGGALASRFGEATIGAPGGDRIGGRPVDLHQEMLQATGIDCERVGDCYVLTRTHTPASVEIDMPIPSAGALVNAVLAGSSLPRLCIRNVPLDSDIAAFLDFVGQGLAEVAVNPARREIELHAQTASSHRVTFNCPSDRNEAVSWAVLSSLTGGQITLHQFPLQDLAPFLDLFDRLGVSVTTEDHRVVVGDARGLTLDGLTVFAGPSPGFHSDWGQVLSVLLALGKGTAHYMDLMYEGRYGSTETLRLFGAHVERFSARGFQGKLMFDKNSDLVEGLAITGVPGFRPAVAAGSDVRGSFAVLIAALVADGVSIVGGLDQLARGYSDLPRRLRGLGANLQMELLEEDFTA